MRHITDLNELFGFLGMTIICEIFEMRASLLKKKKNVTLAYTIWPVHLVYVPKVITDVLTDAETTKLFEKHFLEVLVPPTHAELKMRWQNHYP